MDYNLLKFDYILASIIEKETGKKSEMKKIAGVFLNRLKIKMRLQSDPTVIFSITKGKKFERKLTRKDLKFESQYNTYKIKGLPPTAISIPSIYSIKAVLNPYRGNYFYFVANKKGGHFFSESYEEHLNRIRKLKMNKKKHQMNNKRKGMMIVLSSPSGAGKTTLCKKILENDKNISMSISIHIRSAPISAWMAIRMK